MLRIICLALLVASASAGRMKFIDCGHHEVKFLDVSGCSGDTCVIHKGKTLDLELDFTANQATQHITLSLVASINGVDLEIPGIEKDGCKFVQCPLAKDKEYDLKLSYQVPKALPNTKANVTAKAMGDNGLLGCIRLQGELKD